METILKEIDIALFKLIHQSCSNVFFDLVCPIIRQKTTWIPLYILVVYQVFQKLKSRGTFYFLIITILLIGLSDYLCAHLLKEVFSRLRPCQDESLKTFVHAIIHCSETYSFPSCHATNHFALAYLMINTFYKNFKWIWYGWAGIIGFSQVYCGVHFPFDIIGGSFLGCILGYSAVKILKQERVQTLFNIGFD